MSDESYVEVIDVIGEVSKLYLEITREDIGQGVGLADILQAESERLDTLGISPGALTEQDPIVYKQVPEVLAYYILGQVSREDFMSLSFLVLMPLHSQLVSLCEMALFRKGLISTDDESKENYSEEIARRYYASRKPDDADPTDA